MFMLQNIKLVFIKQIFVLWCRKVLQIKELIVLLISTIINDIVSECN